MTDTPEKGLVSCSPLWRIELPLSFIGMATIVCINVSL
jgi:hypothetical protein